MPQYILKITDDKNQKDYYMEWSTIVDAPVTYGMSLEDFKAYYKDEYGKSGMERLPERLERVEKTGCSALIKFDDLNEFLEFNHAGENGVELDKEGILNVYCRGEH